jgi:hypothetical protein
MNQRVMKKPEYWCMRQRGCISIFLVLVLLASGCIRGTGDQAVIPPPPGTMHDSVYAGSVEG